MSLDSQLLLKWIDPRSSLVHSFNVTVTNHCCFALFDSQKRIIGFTIFETPALNEELIVRLKARIAKLNATPSSFVLYTPKFLQRRLDVLMKNHALAFEVRYTSFLNIQKIDDHFIIRDKLKVISVDDSPVILKLLKHGMDEMGFVEVVSQVSNPLHAISEIQKYKPDVVTMDIQMPGKTGVDVVKELLEKSYYPILMISSLNIEDSSLVIEALNSGAFDYVQKPKLQDKEAFFDDLKNKILLAVEGKNAHSAIKKAKAAAPSKAKINGEISYPENLIWCVGASTGGTQALTQVFTSLPAKIPPTLIVQHIPPVFSRAFADSLANLCPFKVKEAEDGELLLPNTVYIAAGGFQLGIERANGKLRLVQKDLPPVNRFKPSVDFLFKSVAQVSGIKIVAGILTGMGRDGAEGLLELKNGGAKTFAQDQETSVVYGMPRAAHECGAANVVLPLGAIANELLEKSLLVRKAG